MRMVLHAIMQCDDIDVLVILLYYDSKGFLTADIYMHAGHSRKIVTRE